MPDFASLSAFANIPSFGIVAWLVHRTFTTTIPDFQAVVTKQTAQFAQALEKQQNLFLRALADERKETGEALREHREAMREELTRLSSSIDRLNVRTTAGIDPKLGS